MDRKQVRAKLLAKIEAAWPRYKKNPELVSQIELASNDELRKHLVFAESVATAIKLPQRVSDSELSPRYSDDDRARFKRILSTAWNPDGGYTLARDHCGDWYDGPDWAPFNLYSSTSPTGGTHEEQVCANVLMNSVGAEKLWADILLKYARGHCAATDLDARQNNYADSIASRLPSVCADAQANWRAIPQLTPAEFKKQRDELGRRAEQLALELERFYMPRDPDDCEFPGVLDFTELLSPDERDKLDQAIRITTLRIANRARIQAGVRAMDWDEYNDIGSEGRALGYQTGDVHPPAREDAISVYALMLRDHTNPNSDWGYGGVPTLPDMLRRISGIFKADGDWPPIKSPNLGTAERSFFARALCKYFWTSCGDVSPAIVRDIVSMFYAESIREGNVSQILREVKSAYPLPSP